MLTIYYTFDRMLVEQEGIVLLRPFLIYRDIYIYIYLYIVFKPY